VVRKKVDLRVNPLFSGPSLQERETPTETPLGLMQLIPLEQIEFDPGQPRKVFDEALLEELSASIKEFGVICPILVRAKTKKAHPAVSAQKGPSNGFILVAGERRLRASKMAGIKLIPAVIEDSGERAVIRAKQLVENLQREALSPMDRAIALGQLRDKEGWSIREIASKLGISKGLVQRSFEILSLPDDLQAALITGASESKILSLKKVEDRQVRREFIGVIEEYTREQLETAIKQLEFEGEVELYHGGTESKSKAKSSQKLSPQDKRIANELQRELGTKVQLLRKSSNKEQGKLVLDFYSKEDLDGLFKKLVK